MSSRNSTAPADRRIAHESICASPDCSATRHDHRRFCAEHVARFERVADQLKMSFKHGRPAHLVIDDRTGRP
jgi:hypothetical protein